MLTPATPNPQPAGLSISSRRSRRRPVSPLALSMMVAGVLTMEATAQTAPTTASTLETVVVTATRSAEDVDHVLRDVSVIDGATLRANGVVDIADALRALPGVELSLTGPGATPAIFLRGANSNQTLILVDGQRISSSYSGLAALQHLNVDQIERIEVLRGPAASLYGADAIGGVIQVITRRDRNLGVRAAIGEWSSHQLSVNAGLGNADNGLSLTVAQNASRGYNAIVNQADFSYNPDRDGYRFTTLQLNGNWTPTPTLKLGLSAFESRGNVQYDGGPGHDDRIRSRVSNIAATAELTPSSAWKSSLRVGSSTDRAAFDSAYPGTYQTRNDQFAWQNDLRVNAMLRLLGLLESRRETVSGSDPLPVTTRRTQSAVAGGDFADGGWRANASVRIDDSNQYGAKVTANGSAGYQFAPQWRVVFGGGNSFKAPTFNDLYYPGFANPNLKPERGQNVEASVRWASRDSKLSLTAYHNRVRDLIVFQCDANYNCAPQNVATARLQGVTLAAATRLGAWRLDGNVDFGNPRDTTSDRQLARRAREHGALRVSGEVLGVTTGVELIASGKRFDNASNTRVLPAYTLLNLHASKQIVPGMRLAVRVENVTNRDYQLAYGYATGGRRAWLELSLDR